MWRIALVVVIGGLVTLPAASSAHPGNTDAAGGHHCWTNCASWGLVYGQYHFHDGYTPPAPATPLPSTDDWGLPCNLRCPTYQTPTTPPTAPPSRSLLQEKVTGTTLAHVNVKKTIRKPKFKRVRLAVTDVVATVTGLLTITCKRSFRYEYTSKIFTASGVTLRLPLKKADSCSINLSAWVKPARQGDIYITVTSIK